MHLIDDIKYGGRALLKRPLLLIAAVVSIGIGAGLNVGVYSVLRHVMFDSIVTTSSPERLVRIAPGMSYPNYENLREIDNPVDVAAMQMSTLTWRKQQTARMVSAHVVSDNFFDVVGVRPILGQTFTATDRESADRAVISFEFWQRQFDADPAVIGRTMELNGWPYTIIGVLPKGFTAVAIATGNVYVPIGPHVAAALQDRRAGQFDLIGRLRNGVGREQALAALRVTADRLETQFPDENKGLARSLNASGPDAFSFLRQTPFGLIILSAALTVYVLVGLVLFVACANVANLLVARADERRHEISVRVALGASRGRVIQQFLAESLIISALGCAAGALFWRLCAALLARSAMIVDSNITIVPESLPFGYCLVLIVVVTMVCGIAPGIRSHHVSAISGLKARGVGHAFGRFKLQNGLVAAQVTICFVMLAAAVVLLQNVLRLQNTDPGFEVAHTAYIDLWLPTATEGPGLLELRNTIRASPGVEAVTWGSLIGPPLTTHLSSMKTGDAGAVVDLVRVGPRILETMRIPLELGRDLDDEDLRADGVKSVVVNQMFVRRYLPSTNPLGRQFRLPPDSENGRPAQILQIVGVARDTMVRTIGEGRVPALFFPQNSRSLIVRTSQPAENSARMLEQMVKGLEPTGTVVTVTPMEAAVKSALMPTRVATALLGALGAIGVLLSMVGLYAVVNHAATLRRFEIGVRTALGATRTSIARLIVRNGLRIVGAGCVMGCILSIVVMKVLQTVLADSTLLSPVALLFVIALLIVLGIGASLIPALRAAMVDPTIALRQD